MRMRSKAMFRSLCLAALLACVSADAQAQAQRPAAPTTVYITPNATVYSQCAGNCDVFAASTASGVSSYTGPGDIKTGASYWYGLRGYNAAYATGSNNAINVRRASDNSTTNIVILSSGALDIATANTFGGTDATCVGAIAVTTLTVASCSSGTLHVSDPITDANITLGTIITALGTGSGGAGTYTVSISQTAASATFTAAVALFVPEWYDQIATQHATMATAGNQAQLLPNCGNSLPCLSFNGTSDYYNATASAGPSQPYTVSAVINTTSTIAAPNFDYDYLSTYGGGGFIAHTNQGAANLAGGYAGGGASVTAANNVLHAIQTAFNGGGGFINVDGTNTTENFGSNGAGTPVAVGNLQSGNNRFFLGYINEVGFWPILFSGTNTTAVCHNQRVYWTTGGSC